jgi:hypothetical protein
MKDGAKLKDEAKCWINQVGTKCTTYACLVTLTSTFPANKPSQMSRQKLFKFDEGGTSEIILLFWYLEQHYHLRVHDCQTCKRHTFP